MGDLKNSIIYTLYQNNVIDNAIVSFYTSTSGKESYVKFGSMDNNALESGFSQIGTINTTSWTSMVKNVTIGNNEISFTEFM